MLDLSENYTIIPNKQMERIIRVTNAYVKKKKEELASI